MKVGTPFLNRALAMVSGFTIQASSLAAVIVQTPDNTIGAGEAAWSYLVVEAEAYDEKANPAEDQGFRRVDSSGAITSFLGTPVLGRETTASRKAALFTQTAFGQHIDKVTYQLQFAKPGTYYVYMRFTMFENGGNEASYLNEDSFFLPPDWDKDPQTDWPLSDRGGYTEGCCDQGFLTITENGEPVNYSAGDEVSRAYWEGNFHWNKLSTSQFLNAETQGEPNMRHKFVVTEELVGKPLKWTVSYREGGLTIDQWLFSTNPDLMSGYSQADLDRLFVAQDPPAAVTVQGPGDVIGTGEDAWDYLLLEGEDFDARSSETAGTGFTRVLNNGARSGSLGSPILSTNSTASKGGALYTQTAFAQHVDKVTYDVQFAKAGTYYVYMRFTMFENGGNATTYLNEDSFFLPPDWGKDPQTDWPLSDRGGYTEGCCDLGFLTINEDGTPVNRSAGDDAGHAYWEGNFHWNHLSTSQFLNPETQGEPGVRHKYVVTQDQVGKPLKWTVSYREGGVTIDLWLFSTNPDLMAEYSQAQLDQLLLQGAVPPKMAVRRNANSVVVSWPASATTYGLESSATLSPGNWTAVQGAPVVVSGENTMTIEPTGVAGYYRLKKN